MEMQMPRPALTQTDHVPRDRFEHIVRANNRYFYLGKERGMVTPLGGELKMVVPTWDRSLVPHLIADGFWEAWVTVAIINSQLIVPGDVCVDVGAHVGYYTLLMAQQAGDSGKVLALEPQSELHDCLQQTLQLSGLTGYVEAKLTAAWSEENRDLATTCDDWRLSGSTRVIASGEPGGQPGGLRPARGVALDDVCEHIDFIKIDAEGSEPHVLDGARRCIRENHDITILTEWTGEHDHTWLATFLEDFGLRLYFIHNDSKVALTDVSRFGAMPKEDVVNLVLTRRELV